MRQSNWTPPSAPMCSSLILITGCWNFIVARNGASWICLNWTQPRLRGLRKPASHFQCRGVGTGERGPGDNILPPYWAVLTSQPTDATELVNWQPAGRRGPWWKFPKAGLWPPLHLHPLFTSSAMPSYMIEGPWVATAFKLGFEPNFGTELKQYMCKSIENPWPFTTPAPMEIRSQVCLREITTIWIKSHDSTAQDYLKF